MTREDVAGLLGGNGERYSLGSGRHFMEGIQLYIIFDQQGECKGFSLGELNRDFYNAPATPSPEGSSPEEYHPVFEAIQAYRKGSE